MMAISFVCSECGVEVAMVALAGEFEGRFRCACGGLAFPTAVSSSGQDTNGVTPGNVGSIPTTATQYGGVGKGRVTTPETPLRVADVGENGGSIPPSLTPNVDVTNPEC